LKRQNNIGTLDDEKQRHRVILPPNITTGYWKKQGFDQFNNGAG
jgi:hypothetical protein